MDLEYRGALIAEYPDDYQRQRISIDLYDFDLYDSNKENNDIKIGQITGYYYDRWFFQGVSNILEYADMEDDDEYLIFDTLLSEPLVKKYATETELHNFITIDRLYIYKKYRHKGYAMEVMKNIKEIIYNLFHLEPYETLVALIASPFELRDGDEIKLDLSLGNIKLFNEGELEYLPDDIQERLIKFYGRAGFSQAESNSIVLYNL